MHVVSTSLPGYEFIWANITSYSFGQLHVVWNEMLILHRRFFTTGQIDLVARYGHHHHDPLARYPHSCARKGRHVAKNGLWRRGKCRHNDSFESRIGEPRLPRHIGRLGRDCREFPNALERVNGVAPRHVVGPATHVADLGDEGQ